MLKKPPKVHSPILEVVTCDVVIATFPFATSSLVFKKLRPSLGSKEPSYIADLYVDGDRFMQLTIVKSSIPDQPDRAWFAQNPSCSLEYAYGATPSAVYEKFTKAYWPN